MDKPRILVVDDDPAWLEEVVPLLSKSNYSVETASSFDAAREKLLTTTYAAIVMDLKLKEGFEGLALLSGLQFLEELTQSWGKAIVLSAYGTVENMRQAFKRGAYDFVLKQEFNSGAFLGIVQEVVDQWRANHAMRPRRELTPEEEKEYKKATLQLLQGQAIHFDVPSEAVNPWSRESEPPLDESI